jgi:hypothetical protein
MKNKKLPVTEGKPQTARPTKKNNKASDNHEPAIANPYTDKIKNAAQEEKGLNQSKTIHNDLEPGF